MGKARDIFKKIGDTNIKGIFHVKMGTIKEKKDCKHLTEAEEIKKRWKDYTKELYKKGLNETHNHDSVVTHLEPDILECESIAAIKDSGYASFTNNNDLKNSELRNVLPSLQRSESQDILWAARRELKISACEFDENHPEGPDYFFIIPLS